MCVRAGRWRERRRAEQAEADAALARFLAEYTARYEAGDPDVRETSRDFYDNTPSSWRLQVWFSAAFVLFFGLLVLLVLFFEGIEKLTQ